MRPHALACERGLRTVIARPGSRPRLRSTRYRAQVPILHHRSRSRKSALDVGVEKVISEGTTEYPHRLRLQGRQHISGDQAMLALAERDHASSSRRRTTWHCAGRPCPAHAYCAWHDRLCARAHQGRRKHTSQRRSSVLVGAPQPGPAVKPWRRGRAALETLARVIDLRHHVARENAKPKGAPCSRAIQRASKLSITAA